MELTRVIKSIKEKKYDTYQEDDITITSTENYNGITKELFELQKEVKELRKLKENKEWYYGRLNKSTKKSLLHNKRLHR